MHEKLFQLIKTYQREQIEYIQDQMNKIRYFVEGRQFRFAWHIINEVSGLKSASRSKLKAASPKERLEVEITFQESDWKTS